MFPSHRTGNKETSKQFKREEIFRQIKADIFLPSSETAA